MTKLRALQPYLNQPLPDEWKLIPLYQIIDLAYGEGLSDENRVAGNIPVFGSNGIVGYHNHAIVKGPAIIVGRKGSAGEVTWSEVDCFPIDTTFYVQPLIENLDFRWLYYQLVYVNFTRLNAATGVPGLSRSDALDIYIPFFNKTEQSRISKIIQQVDYAIEDIELSIEKAQQLKKALMQHLLSGRLKPDGTWRKPDEFYVDEKFGRVPKGWRACAVADPSIADLEPNYDFVKGKEYAFIPMDALEEGFKGVRQIDYRVIESGGYSRFKNGDILFAKITPCVENGKVAMVEGLRDGLGFGSTEFIVISPKPVVDNWFLYYQLISGNVHRLAISLMEGTTGRQRIPAKIFRKRIYISIPENLNEQKKISEKIRAVEQMITTKQDKITRLQIMKKSLMQNLLTGNVRVQAV